MMNPLIQIILTSDYEVFGNGDGRVDSCMIEPSGRLMNLCDKYGVPMTFFTEVCSYWAYKEVQDAGKFSEGYYPATLMENQLQEMIQRGHDVQLHFHPQWLGYQFIDDTTWELNYKLWRLSQVPSEPEDKNNRNNITGLFYQGKQTLEDLLCPIRPDYKCFAFRAGSFSIQPEEEILKAMYETGIEIDSTVAPGVYLDNGLSYYDFRQRTKNGPYTCSTSVTLQSRDGFVKEIPIYTIKMSGWKKLNMFLKGRSLPYNACNCKGKPANKVLKGIEKPSLMKKMMSLLSPSHQMFDFCGRKSSEELIYYVKSALEWARRGRQKGPLPIVAIGHPKNFGNEKEFDIFLRWCKEQPEVGFGKFNRNQSEDENTV